MRGERGKEKQLIFTNFAVHCHLQNRFSILTYILSSHSLRTMAYMIASRAITPRFTNTYGPTFTTSKLIVMVGYSYQRRGKNQVKTDNKALRFSSRFYPSCDNSWSDVRYCQMVLEFIKGSSITPTLLYFDVYL